MTQTQHAHVPHQPRWTLILFGIQILLAVVILSLAAYGVYWIPYNALIFSLVVCICTFVVSVYMIVSQTALPKMYNMWAALALHILMIIFWVVNLGLTANLARLWAAPGCTYYYWYGYSCSYGKRDLGTIAKREYTSFTTYYGALAASAFFAAAEGVLFVATIIILIMAIQKHRTNAINNQPENLQSQPPPQYAANNGQNVPMEKYNHQLAPQQQYQGASVPQPQPQHSQPIQPVQPPQQAYNQQQYPVPYQQDPLNRQNTVSPVSQVGYAAPPRQSNTTELQSPQATYHPNASELSSPQHTGSYNPNTSELSSLQHTGSYNPNASELSNTQPSGQYNPNLPELSNQR